MFRKPIRETVAVFPAQESQLAGLRKTVEEICHQTSLTSKDINNIILAIEEGATNIIRHAYLLGDGEIRLKVAAFKDFIIFSLFDHGKSFQPPDKTKLDLKKMSATGRKGGLGFYLINKVMDRVEYFSLEGENELRLTKFLTDKGEKKLQWSGGLSLRVKFSAWTFLIVLILVAGAYYFIDSSTTRYIRSRLDKTISALSNTIAAQTYGYIINHRSDVEFDELAVSYQRANNDILIAVVVVDKGGDVLADSRGLSRLHTLYDPKKLELISTVDSQAVFYPEGGNPILIRKVNYGGVSIGTVIMEYSIRGTEAQLKQAQRTVAIVTGIGLLIGIAGIYLLSNYFVRPIGRIVSRVRRFSEGDLDSQLPLTGAEEFYEISKGLNELIMRIRRDRKNIIEREILQKEMQMAEEIQRALIPKTLPTIQGVDIGAIYKAARMVGGDLFDFVRIDDYTIGVAVADVSGKGIPGSLVMSMVRTALRLESRGNKSSRNILVHLNDFVADDIKRGRFVTILLCIIDTRTGKMNFASAGHNPMIHFSSESGQASFLNARGMPVGIKAGQADFAISLEEATVDLHKNDFLVIYTDGVTESRVSRAGAYGTDRIIDILKENAALSASEVAAIIEADLTRFIGRREQHDDITMVILKNCPPSDRSESVPASLKDHETSDSAKSQIDLIAIKANGDSSTLPE